MENLLSKTEENPEIQFKKINEKFHYYSKWKGHKALRVSRIFQSWAHTKRYNKKISKKRLTNNFGREEPHRRKKQVDLKH